ncbi:unnamed protein product, partial [Musa textilis]
ETFEATCIFLVCHWSSTFAISFQILQWSSVLEKSSAFLFHDLENKRKWANSTESCHSF